MEPVKYVHETDVHNLSAPSEVVPLLISMFNPQSVLDVGCGIGTWLNIFKTQGVSDILGIDGDYVNQDLLKVNISIENFRTWDLTMPFHLQRKFDLAICLEVAEHLPETSSGILIESLCEHADTVVFSAAIPWQGGQNHINEQWTEYWVKLFAEHRFDAYDLLRPVIWKNEKIDLWYRQNMLIFSKRDLSHLYSKSRVILDIVHPDFYLQKLMMYQNYVTELETKLWG